MEITSGRIPTAVKVVIYGPEGIGKTTFASRFPDPVFIDTEGSTAHMNVRRLPRPALWVELLNEVEYIRQNPGCCKTLVVDTADWAETLCGEYICARDQKTGVEDYGYGKGYKFLFEEFGRLLNALEQVRDRGVHIVICCHAAIRKFEQPDELGAYDRWGLKLTDTPRASIAGMVKEWADMVLFANYKTIVVNVDGKGAAKGKNKVQGGRRVMYTTHHSCWDAKNRFGLPDEMEFGYEGVRDIIEGGAPQTEPAEPANRGGPQTPEKAAAAASPEMRPDARSEPEAQPTPKAAPEKDPFAGLPDALARMMREAQVTPDEVRYVIAQKGIYPMNTPWSVICANADFMKGWLLHPQVWPQVINAVKVNRENDPF